MFRRVLCAPTFPLGTAALAALAYAGCVVGGLWPGTSDATAVLLAGAALLSAAFRFRVGAALCGAAAVLLGAVGVAGGFTAVSGALRALEPIKPVGIQTGVCLALAGSAAILAGSTRHGNTPLVPAVFGTVLTAIAGGALLGSFHSSAMPGDATAATPMPAAVALVFVVAGAGLLTTAARLRSSRSLAPVLAATLLLTFAFYLFHWLTSVETATLNWSTELALSRFTREVGAALDGRFMSLEGMAHRWEARPQSREEEWVADARLYLSHFSAYQALIWVDESLDPRWNVSSSGTEPALDGLLKSTLQPMLTRCRSDRTLSVSGAFDLTPASKGLAACAPMLRGGTFAGALVTVTRVTGLFETIISATDLGGYSVEVRDTDRTIYRHPAEGVPPGAGWKLFPFHIRGVKWDFLIWPDGWTLQRNRSHLPALVLLLGVVVACLSSLAVHFAQSAALRARQAEMANLDLQREIADRKLAQEDAARTRQELERRVEERTAELARANEELRYKIAERERFEDSLRAGEQRYRELFDNANDMVFVHDLDGRVLDINKAAQRMTGYTQTEALGMNVSQLVGPEYEQVMGTMVARQLAGEPPSTYELTAVTKGGDRPALEVSTHLVFSRGRPVAVQGIARDITERRRLEETLRHSQKMEAVGRLAGGLAHDFNNLITIVAAYAQMIAEELPEGDVLRAHAEEILASAERAGALTNRLLAFSRRQVLKPQVVDLNGLIAGLENMLRRLISEDIETTFELEPGLASIKADPNQLEQVLMNLVINARDAMPRGGRLTIQTAPADVAEKLAGGASSGGHVRLTVRDTGVGMTDEVRSRIFEPFFTTKEPGKGTGLGLSTVYGIVRQSGGDITVESRPGKGSSFHIFFPKAVIEEEAPVSARPGNGGQSAGKRGTILLVEDEPGVRRLVRRMLVERGYRVVEAADGEEALTLCRELRPPADLVLTDIVMPNLNGADLAGELRRAHPDVRILFMTGYTDEAIRDYGVAPAAEILRKPFLAETLEQRVRELLERRPPGDPAPRV